MKLDSNNEILLIPESPTNRLRQEEYDSQYNSRKSEAGFNRRTMVTFHNFCMLIGYELVYEELYQGNSDIMVFDKKTKIKRSNSMRDKKFVPQ